MDNKELICRLEALKSEADALIAELNRPEPASQSNATETMLKKYIDAFGEGRSCYAIEDVSGNVVDRYGYYKPDASNPFSRYLSKDYAEFAERAKRFTDACLAFKWCWDADYNPNWKNATEYKWYIVFNYFNDRFSVRHCELLQEMRTVYFSTKEIAESCADWLHSTGLYA